MPKTMNNFDEMPKGNKTEATKKTDPDLPNVFSIYLKDHERDALLKVVEELGVSRHAVLKYAVLFFLKEYRAGKVQVETETKTKTEIIL